MRSFLKSNQSDFKWSFVSCVCHLLLEFCWKRSKSTAAAFTVYCFCSPNLSLNHEITANIILSVLHLLFLFCLLLHLPSWLTLTGKAHLCSEMQANEIQCSLWISITKCHFHITSYLTELCVFWWLFRKEDTLWCLPWRACISLAYISGHEKLWQHLLHLWVSTKDHNFLLSIKLSSWERLWEKNSGCAR